VFGEDAMTFTIHASKNGQSVVTVRISPAVAVDRARVLEGLGWQVHITDSAGHQFDPSDFDRLSSIADEIAAAFQRLGFKMYEVKPACRASAEGEGVDQ
jgi:hypothetical protein